MNLRAAFLENADVSDEDAIQSVIEFPLTELERERIRERVRGAADNLEKWAAASWGQDGAGLTMDERMELVRWVDQAKRMRAMADALEKK